jgi:hypothetical protein
MESSAFMKTNGSMLQGGKLKREFYQSWANYYAKFIKAYEKKEFLWNDDSKRTNGDPKMGVLYLYC